MTTRKTLPLTRAPAVPPEALQSWLSVVRAFHQCDAVLNRRLAPSTARR